ncbi:tryptophan halogenase family protein [Microbulbifer hydrolyticus]|uniref:Tryptophan halogenase n=2 Tax=Microbulbifer hydrolyticus TaxID=48074 RepID=A0AA89PET9_9GAMM|nr:tryptophan halogenase family protein [Microbulbifer hydrolyticus]MBB5212668.1 tryptophan halogenase [Microbulbifer hydrolyticus]
MSADKRIRKVVIAGGGTAGWMTAAALSKLLGKNLDIKLVESEAIGTVGVGEATIPTLHLFHQLLGIDERELMAATNATFKLGIAFENWKDVGEEYIHSFGAAGKDCWACNFSHFWVKGLQQGIDFPIGDYTKEHLGARLGRFAVSPRSERTHAYHFDAALYAKFLRGLAEKHGATRIEGKIDKVQLDRDSGYIRALQLDSGEVLEGDLFIDCTGFRGLLIDGALHTGFDDWGHWLPCDRAIAVQTGKGENPVPYTRSIARESGWQWRIPLQTRTGNGLVYCSHYMDEEQARQQLLDNVEGEPLNEPRVIPFRTGTRRQHWNKNCVAIGLSSGFIEPLESTSIHLIQRSIVRLMTLFPAQGFVQADVDEFNRLIREETENVRDFVVLHYKLTDRQDTEFWRYCRGMDIPDSLSHRMEMFEQGGRVYQNGTELFGESSWLQVLLGQGLMPQSYHPIVDMMSDEELARFLSGIRSQVRATVDSWPHHMEFIAHYCKTKIDQM